MKLKVDKASDALYFRLDEAPILESEEVHPGVIREFNAEGKVVGVEFLKIGTRVSPEQLQVLHCETK